MRQIAGEDVIFFHHFIDFIIGELCFQVKKIIIILSSQVYIRKIPLSAMG